MSGNKTHKLYEVDIPIMGYMKLHLRANEAQEALLKAGEIALEMEKEAPQTIVPNLCKWRIDRTIRPIVNEKGESDE